MESFNLLLIAAVAFIGLVGVGNFETLQTSMLKVPTCRLSAEAANLHETRREIAPAHNNKAYLNILTHPQAKRAISW